MLTVKILPTTNPPGKLADVELHFTRRVHEALALQHETTDFPEYVDADEALAGLKLIGFAVWERKSGNGRNVTFPARQYSVNGERRSFALLRPVTETDATSAIRDLILAAYAAHEAREAAATI